MHKARRQHRPLPRPAPDAAGRFAACKQALLDNVPVSPEQLAAFERAAAIAPYRPDPQRELDLPI